MAGRYGFAARAATPSGLSRFASSCLHRIAIAWRALFPPPHRHEWHDWYVFDSSAMCAVGGFGGYRVCAQQIMQLCACGQTKRKHLRTWREARIARHLLPYQRWGVWSFSLPVPAAIATEARRAETATEIGGSVHEGAGPQGHRPNDIATVPIGEHTNE